MKGQLLANVIRTEKYTNVCWNMLFFVYLCNLVITISDKVMY